MMRDEDSQKTLQALALLARGLAGADLDVQPLRRVGGDDHKAARTVLAGSCVYLPASLLSPNEGQAYGRASLAHAVAHWCHSPRSMPATGLKPMGIAVASAIEDARAEAMLCRDFPGVRAWFAEALAPLPAPEDLSFTALIARVDRLLMFPAGQDDNYWVNKASDRFQHTLALAGPDDYDAFRALASILANDLGQMRVPFDVQQYVVPSPYRDDNSVLWRFDETRQPPDAAEALQTAGTSPPRGEHAGRAHDADGLVQASYLYPEWNRQLDRLRPDWCTVIEQRQASQGPHSKAAHRSSHRQASSVRLPQHRQVDHTKRLRREWDGDQIDLDRAIEVNIERRLQLPSEPRVFMRPGKRHPPASVLVLMDLSASSNDRRSPSTPSLLDIEKHLAMLMADAAQQRRDRLAIHGFSSNTRAEVHYTHLLDFGMPLSPTVCQHIDALTGRYSTRLGAAVRHAGALLKAEENPRRALLVVTDGAPSDIDVSDARYLAEDARMAILDTRIQGMQTCCIALDGAAEADVRRMFGARHYGIADTVDRLSMQVTRMYARLVAG